MSKRDREHRSTEGVARPLAGRHETWAVLAAAACLTLLLAAPVLRHPSERLFGSEIVGRVHDPYTVAYQFEHPAPPGIYTQPLTDYLGALFALLLGSGIAAYNVLVLASFPLAAVAAFLLARHLSGSRIAAWIAAFAFGFAPSHIAHAAYHPHIAQTHWLPLYFLALWALLERRDRKRTVLFTLASLAVVLSNYYGGLIAATLTPFVIAGQRVGHSPRARSSQRFRVRGLAALASVAAVLAIWLVIVAPRVITNPQSLAFSLEDAVRYSARWESYVLPPIEHPLWGALARDTWRAREVTGALVEQQLTIGVSLALLALVTIPAWSRRRVDPLLRSVPLLWIVAAVAFLFSLPPRWTFAGVSLLSPSGLLHAILPMFRAYARFGIVVQLAVALLAGIGAAVLIRSRRTASSIAVGTLLLLALLELSPLPPWRWRDVLPTTAHRWLAETSGPLRLLDCTPASDPANRSVRHLFRHPIRFLGASEDCGDPGVPDALAAEDITHVLVRRNSPLGERWMSGSTPPGLRLVERFADSAVWKVSAPEPRVFVRAIGGLSWREYQNDRSFRWMADRADLEIVVPGSGSVRGHLELVLHAFPIARRVLVTVDGESVEELVVGTEPSVYTTRSLQLSRGSHPLTITTPEAPVVADEVLDNGDLRPLAVAIGAWRFVPMLEPALRTLEDCS